MWLACAVVRRCAFMLMLARVAVGSVKTVGAHCRFWCECCELVLPPCGATEMWCATVAAVAPSWCQASVRDDVVYSLRKMIELPLWLRFLAIGP